MLIHCIAYQNGAKLTDLPVESISDYLLQPDCFVWVALCDTTDTELNQLQTEFGLHDLAIEDARHGHQRPKIEEYDDTLFVAMHIVTRENTELTVGEFSIFVGSNFIISIRNRSKQHFLGVRERCEREPERLQLGAGFVFYALMDAVVDHYFPVIEELESHLEAIEEHLFDQGAASSNIAKLYALKRKVVVLRHAVTPLMDATSRLYGGRVPPVCVAPQAYFRDVYDHLTRINASIENIRDTLTTAILVCQSSISIEQNDINKRLAAWGGIFAVATLFAGIWGMNFQHIPELKWEFGYPLALLTMAGTGGYLYYRFKRAGWL